MALPQEPMTAPLGDQLASDLLADLAHSSGPCDHPLLSEVVQLPQELHAHFPVTALQTAADPEACWRPQIPHQPQADREGYPSVTQKKTHAVLGVVMHTASYGVSCQILLQSIALNAASVAAADAQLLAAAAAGEQLLAAAAADAQLLAAAAAGEQLPAAAVAGEQLPAAAVAAAAVAAAAVAAAAAAAAAAETGLVVAA